MVRQTRHTVTSLPAIPRFYRRLLAHFGKQHWWPGHTRFEIILGAILTQNTNWKNVEKVLVSLRRTSGLAPRALARLPQRRLPSLLRPSGYFRQKARTLITFLDYLRRRYRYSVHRMFRVETQRLRAELLALRGIGEETVDSILLYAGRRPVFVIDAYTRRILMRHGLAPPDAPYAALQKLFEENFPSNPTLYNEYHALFVAAGKRYCHRLQPDCFACPLGPELEKPYARS
ncbi:MAG: endonuclease III domain-containing protein [Terriglobia bacterium]